MKFVKIKWLNTYVLLQTSSTESLSLFPNARLELCDMYCDSQNLNIHTSISLKVSMYWMKRSINYIKRNI